jgi:hypothetical protein
MEANWKKVKVKVKVCGHLVRLRRLAYNIPASAFCWANAAEFTAFLEQMECPRNLIQLL